MNITASQLAGKGLTAAEAAEMEQRLRACFDPNATAESWSAISQTILTPRHPFPVHQLLYDAVFAGWDERCGPRPAWMPTEAVIRASNEGALMREVGVANYEELHRWSVANRQDFWRRSIERLGIRFRRGPRRILDLGRGVESPSWLPGARLNIVESCFAAPPETVAIRFQREGGPLEEWSLGQLERLTWRVAGALVGRGFRPGDAFAVDMPMTAESVAIYLGVIAMGGVVVSIADSFMPSEIATRLRLGGAKAVFTQDVIPRGGKTHPMYEKVVAAGGPMAIVLPAGDALAVKLRPGDVAWRDFLGAAERFDVVERDPDEPLNVLFSSGTTGEPKAIPWDHTTPIKCAADAHFHLNIQPADVLAWPTSLGWMMGPWLIFASLINRATMALYYGAPTGAGFGHFVERARITMLGLVPSLVKTWRNSGCLEGADWSAIRLFGSTGECSNAEDYLWLMSRAGYKPVIEYCGGTEIGGGYITGTVTRPASPATFSTLALGLDAVILDEQGRPAEEGELFLIPPSIGLSQKLLNKDHHAVYYADTPPGPRGERLRRHGDQLERLPGGFYRAHGRADDTMNLGGIKVSSAEIERTLQKVPEIQETAAIAVEPKGGGPSLLIIYAVLRPGASTPKEELLGRLQNAIKKELNPLFKIHDVVVVESLPRTASNKVMRRVLRSQYGACPNPP